MKNYITLYRKKNHNKVLEFENFGSVWIVFIYDKNKLYNITAEIKTEEFEKIYKRLTKNKLYYINHN